MVSLTLFAAGTILSLILIFVGISMKEEQNFGYSAIAGFMLMCLIGLILLANPLQYISGTTVEEVYVYGNNFDGYHWDGYNITAPPQANKEAFLFHVDTTSTNNYSEDGSLINYLISIIMVLAGGAGVSMMANYYWVKKRTTIENE